MPPPPQPPPVDAPREGCACERADPPRGACFPSEQGLEHSISPNGFMQTRPPRGEIETENRLLVFENSFSPAVDSPRRPIKKSLTPTGTRTATRENPARSFLRRSQNRKTLNALPPTPGTSARVRRARETKGGSSRGPRAHQHEHEGSQAHDTRKPESQNAARETHDA